MKTRLLMAATALVTGALGVAASFLPQEILSYCGAAPRGLAVILVQLAGALYVGFAILNWTARANLIGGIYSRPVALANFLHFAAGACALAKGVGAGLQTQPMYVGTAIYVVFAVWFGLVVFIHPAKDD